MQPYAKQLETLLGQGNSKIDAAYAVVQKMILDDRFSAGQVLSERTLVEELGISRTPIRAALNRLCYDGYLDMKADVCTIVAELGIQDILELYEIREALECKAVELFTQRRTDAEEQALVRCFEAHKRAVAEGDDATARNLDNQAHLLIAKGSKNGRLYTALDNYITLSLRSVAIGTSYEYRYDRSLPQHQDIIGAIVKDDPALAAQAMRAHMVDVREFFKMKFVEGY